MKYVIQTGCDGAALCFFDPAALPLDFDNVVSDDPVALMLSLQEQQRCWFTETEGDGGYLFHIYWQETLPSSLLAHATSVAYFPKFSLPSGKLCICGAEYMANNPLIGSAFTPKGGLAKYAQMGQIIELDAGNYDITVFQCAWSDEAWDEMRQTLIPDATYQRYARLQLLMLCCLGIGAIGLFFGVPFAGQVLFKYLSTGTAHWQTAVMLLLISSSIFALGYGLVKWYNKSAITQTLDNMKKEMPDYLLDIKPVGSNLE